MPRVKTYTQKIMKGCVPIGFLFVVMVPNCHCLAKMSQHKGVSEPCDFIFPFSKDVWVHIDSKLKQHFVWILWEDWLVTVSGEGPNTFILQKFIQTVPIYQLRDIDGQEVEGIRQSLLL